MHGQQTAGDVVAPIEVGAADIELANANAFDRQFAGTFRGRGRLFGFGIAGRDVLPVVKTGGVLGEVQCEPMQIHAVHGDAAAQ